MMAIRKSTPQPVTVLVKHGRPDPVRNPRKYMRWLREMAAKGLKPIPDMPMIDDAYRVTTAAGEVTLTSFSDKNKRWYVVQTHPQAETKAAGGLKDAGLEVYVPRSAKWVASRRRPKAVVVDGKRTSRRAIERRRATFPLFPGYVFAAFPVARLNFGVIRAIDGVRCILGWGGEPRAVPSAFLMALFDQDRRGCFDKTRGTESPFKAGERVRVIEGPFASFIAKIVGMGAHERVKALLNIFGRATEIEIDVADLERVSAR